MRRVLRWDVLINDTVQEIGGGKVVFVHCRPDELRPGPARRVEVWTEEEIPDGMSWKEFGDLPMRKVAVFGTAHPISDGLEHIGSAVDPNPMNRLVWHVYEVPES